MKPILIILAFLFLANCSPKPQVAEVTDPMHKPWKMHHVNNDYVVANSLNAADVDQDGYLCRYR